MAENFNIEPFYFPKRLGFPLINNRIIIKDSLLYFTEKLNDTFAQNDPFYIFPDFKDSMAIIS